MSDTATRPCSLAGQNTANTEIGSESWPCHFPVDRVPGSRVTKIGISLSSPVRRGEAGQGREEAWDSSTLHIRATPTSSSTVCLSSACSRQPPRDPPPCMAAFMRRRSAVSIGQSRNMTMGARPASNCSVTRSGHVSLSPEVHGSRVGIVRRPGLDECSLSGREGRTYSSICMSLVLLTHRTRDDRVCCPQPINANNPRAIADSVHVRVTYTGTRRGG